MTYQEVKCKKSDVREILKATFPDYRGRKYVAKFQDSFTFYDTNWSGGTRNEYRFLRTDGKVASPIIGAPWCNPVEGLSVAIPRNVMIVEHTFFCGSDLGIRIYLHSEHMPKWIEG